MSNTYFAEVYVLDEDAKIPLKSYIYQSTFSFSKLLQDSTTIKPLMLLLWVGLIALAFLMGNIPLFGILGTILAWIEFGLFSSYLVVSGTVLKTVICLTIVYFGRKKEDLE
jgi:hypothetical protein